MRSTVDTPPRTASARAKQDRSGSPRTSDHYLHTCFAAFRDVTEKKYGTPFDLPAIEASVAALRNQKPLTYDDLRDFESPRHWWFQKYWVFPPEPKTLAFERMRYLGALRYMLPWLPAELDEIEAVFGGDPWPYGVEANRPTLEALVRFLSDQPMIARPVAIDGLFAPVRGHHWGGLR